MTTFGGISIALYEPDIPQNTGTILRLCACLGMAAHLIEPAGFPVTDRAFRRAGMDYLDDVAITRHASWQAFESWRRQEGRRVVLFTTRVGTAILVESGLSFLGLGVPPPAPTWGSMLSGSGRTYMFQGPWLALAPGLCLTAVVYATNVFGDALRDLLDPRQGDSH